MDYKNKTKAELISVIKRLEKQLTLLKKDNSLQEKKDSLIENGTKFYTLVESANDAIFLLKGEIFIDCNTKTVEIFGLKSKKDIVGKAPYYFSPERQPDGRLSRDKALEFIFAARKGIPQFFEWQHCKQDRTPFDTEVSLNRLPPPHEDVIIAIVRDITERKRAEENLRSLNTRLMEEHRQRKLLSKRLIQLLESHNRKISMDLHDHIGQTLVTLKIDLDLIADRVKSPDTSLKLVIEKAKAKTIQAIEDIEKISHGLRPSMLDTLGLLPSLRDLFEEVKKQTNIEIHFFTRDIPKRFDPEKELTIFRVVQEGLTNVIKHSRAKNCFVNLIKKDNSIVLSVEDDGVGFKANGKLGASKGKIPLGLIFMKERVIQLNGEFSIESRVGGGVHLFAEIPI